MFKKYNNFLWEDKMYNIFCLINEFNGIGMEFDQDFLLIFNEQQLRTIIRQLTYVFFREGKS